jgi:hypothetical protein
MLHDSKPRKLPPFDKVAVKFLAAFFRTLSDFSVNIPGSAGPAQKGIHSSPEAVLTRENAWHSFLRERESLERQIARELSPKKIKELRK